MNELSELLNDQNAVVSLVIPHLEHVIEMVEKNIFRPLPIISTASAPGEMGQEEEVVILDPIWPHLLPIYEFFLQLIVNDAADVKSLKQFVTHTFIQEVRMFFALSCKLLLYEKFLELFNSEEYPEREYLKNILHRLYAKVNG